MKLKELSDELGQTLYILEKFDKNSICSPSVAFVDTIKNVKELNFLEQVKGSLGAVCKERFFGIE